jgi:nucleoside-diphosphate-sugar epimerase
VARSVLVLGGTGMVGRALVRRFLEAGWEVAVGARNPVETEGRFVAVDRTEDAQLAAALGDGVDVLVDVVAYTAEDGRRLVRLGDRVGSVVAISSLAVYADGEGRSLDTQETGFPRFPVPLTERQPTVAPGDETYAARKVALERVLLESPLRATVVRPGAIHGPGAVLPRELYFTKRALDGRRAVVLAHRGETRFHTTSVANLAELVWLAAERPGTRVVNCGDPSPPTGVEIARACAAALDVEWAEVLLPGAAVEGVGDTPWSVPASVVVSMAEAELELRYRPVTTYAAAVRETVRWLVESRPEPTSYLASMFDYAREDAFLAGLAGSG